MEEGSKRIKDRRFIVDLRDRAMNIIYLLYVKIESKSSDLIQKNARGSKEDIFFSLLCLRG